MESAGGGAKMEKYNKKSAWKDIRSFTDLAGRFGDGI